MHKVDLEIIIVNKEFALREHKRYDTKVHLGFLMLTETTDVKKVFV